MSDDINDGGMERNVSEMFVKKVSPELEARLTGDIKKDPLLDVIARCQKMVNGLDSMLEATLLLNAHTIETQIPELKDQFATNIGHLRDMIREGNSLAAQQKLEDVVRTFSSYKRVTASLFGRVTNIVSEFPKYSSEINDISYQLSDIRSELLDDKALVITEDDYKRLAIELYKVIVENAKKKSGEDVDGVDKSTEEIVDEKKSVVGKLRGA